MGLSKDYWHIQLSTTRGVFHISGEAWAWDMVIRCGKINGFLVMGPVMVFRSFFNSLYKELQRFKTIPVLVSVPFGLLMNYARLWLRHDVPVKRWDGTLAYSYHGLSAPRGWCHYYGIEELRATVYVHTESVTAKQNISNAGLDKHSPA
jgi:hypothetical protein